MPVKLLLQSQGAEATHEANTVDLSLGGVRVRVPVALVPGQVLEVIPKDAPKLSIASRVVWIGRAGSALEGQAGLEFLRTSPRMTSQMARAHT